MAHAQWNERPFKEKIRFPVKDTWSHEPFPPPLIGWLCVGLSLVVGVKLDLEAWLDKFKILASNHTDKGSTNTVQESLQPTAQQPIHRYTLTFSHGNFTRQHPPA